MNRFHLGNLIEQFLNSRLIGRIVIHCLHKPLIVLLNKDRGCQPKCTDDLDFRGVILVKEWKQELRLLNLLLLLTFAERIFQYQDQ